MSEPHVRRRLAAILAADVAGFSRLMGVDEEGVLVRLKAFEHDIIAPLVHAHDGHVFKSTGDGFLAEFASVVDSVRCALALQKAIAERNAASDPGAVLVFRMGINVGDVLVADGDFHGDGVNLAARLQTVAELGGIAVSAKVHEEVVGKVPARFEDLGSKHLRGFDRPVHVYAVMVGSDRRPDGRRARLALAAGVALALALGLWAAFDRPDGTSENPTLPRQAASLEGPRPAAAPAAAVPRLSIAVLPFVNLSGDAAQDYLADAITEDLTTDLSRIAGSFVISRSTASTFKGTGIDVRQVGRELGVRYMLEGSVRARDDQMRLTAQLVDVESGGHIWSDRFDRPRAEWTGVEDEIIGQIARVVDIELVAAESRRSLRERKVDPDAGDLAMRGWAVLNQPQTRETTRDAVALFEAAVRRDDQAVEALVGLSFAHLRSVANRWSTAPAEEQRIAEDTIGKALALDPRHATAHMVRGIIFRLQRRFEDAIASFRTALRFNPNLAPAVAQLGQVLILTGQTTASLEQFHKALRLSPRDPNLGLWLMFVGWAHLLQGEAEPATEWLRRSLAANPGFGMSYAIMAGAHALAGRRDDALASIADFKRLMPNDTVSQVLAAQPTDNPVFRAQLDRLMDLYRQLGLIE